MPLSPPADRKPIHARTVECRGYRREDGLWDIEGHLVDTKSYVVENRFRGDIAPGVPIHEMWLRLTIDSDMLVHAAEAATEHGPFPMCPDVTPRFAALKGLRIGPGWRREVTARVGGVLGCTHLVELIGPVATTAYQTLVAKRREREEDPEATQERPDVLDTCHALASDSPVVEQLWPDFYTGRRSA